MYEGEQLHDARLGQHSRMGGFSLEYGIEEEFFLSDKDKEMITRFIAENFPNGYTMSVDWDSYKEFDRYPAFGKPCKTYKVIFCNI